MLEPFMKGPAKMRDTLYRADRMSFLKVCELVVDSTQRMGDAFYFLEGLVEAGYKVNFAVTDDDEMKIGMTVIRPDGTEFGFKSEVAVGCLVAAKESLERAVLSFAAGKDIN